MVTAALTQRIILLVLVACLLLGGSLAVPAIRLREPEFDPMPGKVTHKMGDRARLFCSVRYLGERTVAWRKVPSTNPLTIGTTTWIEDSRIWVDHAQADSQWDLIIQEVTSRDAGQYECQVSVRRKLLRQVVDLYVTENTGGQVKRNPDIMISGAQFVPRGSNISLYCNASKGSNLGRLLAWFKGAQEITLDDHRVSIHDLDSQNIREQVTSNLHIQGAQLDDSGLYTCRARDEKLMTSAHVSVLTGGSNNVKRAGTSGSGQESGAVVRFQPAISHRTLMLLMLLLQHGFT